MGKSYIIFYDSDKLDENDYVINEDQIILNFDPSSNFNNEYTKLNVLTIEDDNTDFEILKTWTIESIPGERIYQSDIAFEKKNKGFYLVFCDSNLVGPSDYFINDEKNEFIMSNELVQHKNTIKIYFFALGNILNLNVKDWRIKTVANVSDYELLKSNKLQSGIYIYIVFYGANKLQKDDFDVEEGKLKLKFTPNESGINIYIYYIGKK